MRGILNLKGSSELQAASLKKICPMGSVAVQLAGLADDVLLRSVVTPLQEFPRQARHFIEVGFQQPMTSIFEQVQLGVR